MDASGYERLNAMIGDIEIAMLTSVGPDGMLHSRPMAAQLADDEGVLWFFTHAGSEIVYESNTECRVNVSFIDEKRSVYLSVSGTADISDDRDKMNRLWKPQLSAWFPKGLADEGLRLIRVRIQRAEFWDMATSALALLFGAARQAITGQTAGIGKHERLV